MLQACMEPQGCFAGTRCLKSCLAFFVCAYCRVLLPINFESVRGVVIGEGKPENQNHAVVFCPGEALQTIDCNQDNIVAEGLKLRNLLAELLPEGWDTVRPRGRPTLTQVLRQSPQRWMGLQGGASDAAGVTDNAALLKQVTALVFFVCLACRWAAYSLLVQHVT